MRVRVFTVLGKIDNFFFLLARLGPLALGPTFHRAKTLRTALVCLRSKADFCSVWVLADVEKIVFFAVAVVLDVHRLLQLPHFFDLRVNETDYVN